MIRLTDNFTTYLLCEYLGDRRAALDCFTAASLSAEELEETLKAGLCKFGITYFKPMCGGCQMCVPVRIDVKNFCPSKSQRRTLKRGRDIKMFARELNPKKEIFYMFKNHSIRRFGKEPLAQEFLKLFYEKSCPGMQTEYYLADKLIAVGYIDIASRSLSSGYFFYDTYYSSYRLGVLSVLTEIRLAAEMGKEWYYLGYSVDGNTATEYKKHFYPHEFYDWQSKIWKRENR